MRYIFLLLVLACDSNVKIVPVDVVEEVVTDLDGDGYSESEGDCDDSNPMLHPDADEVCDEVDNNCDGLLDEDPVSGPVWYVESESGCFDEILISCTEPDVPFFEQSQQCD